MYWIGTLGELIICSVCINRGNKKTQKSDSGLLVYVPVFGSYVGCLLHTISIYIL
jgi:hypothetical protein